MKKLTIAFGPKRNKIVGSWRWFGEDLAKELEKYYNIKYVEQNKKCPKCDVLIIVKNVEFAVQQMKYISPEKIIYLSIDHFKSPTQLRNERIKLKNCITVHQSESMMNTMEQYCKEYFINHHIKFGQEFNQYQEFGPIFWVGGSQYIDIILKYLNEHKINKPIKMVTTGRHKGKYINLTDIEYTNWTPDNQLKIQKQCKVAIDIKGFDWWQKHKPTTKLMDYIAAGLPPATNKISHGYEYLLKLGFDCCSPEETDRWFSRDYYLETLKFRNKVIELCSLENIGLKYREIIDNHYA